MASDRWTPKALTEFPPLPVDTVPAVSMMRALSGSHGPELEPGLPLHQSKFNTR
jgi:hypothetical protein